MNIATAGQSHKHPIPDSHAPIMVMGDHRHNQGEWMVSYRFMRMKMEGNLQGDNDISPDQIVTTVLNRFFGMPMMPPTLRIVPIEMITDMHMVGAMYAPSNAVTLMAMVNYLEKEMDHLTYAGGTGTTLRPEMGFTTKTSGFGDAKFSALIKMADTVDYKVHFNLGISIPTGGIDEKDDILTPMGPSAGPIILPYAMQLGSGSWDLEPGITYTGVNKLWSWGGQYKAKLRLADNDEDYRLGDEHKVTAWGGFRIANWLSSSLRLTYTDLGRISGIDSRIMGPVQTADPNNYGGERLDLGIGFNLLGQLGAIKHHRLGLEYETPIQNDVNGVQMEMQDMLTLGYQYAF